MSSFFRKWIIHFEWEWNRGSNIVVKFATRWVTHMPHNSVSLKWVQHLCSPRSNTPVSFEALQKNICDNRPGLPCPQLLWISQIFSFTLLPLAHCFIPAPQTSRYPLHTHKPCLPEDPVVCLQIPSSILHQVQSPSLISSSAE